MDGDGAPIPADMMTELIYSSDKDSAGGSRPREGINSSSSGAYEDSDLDGEASASSAHPSSPAAARVGCNPGAADCPARAECGPGASDCYSAHSCCSASDLCCPSTENDYAALR